MGDGMRQLFSGLLYTLYIYFISINPNGYLVILLYCVLIFQIYSTLTYIPSDEISPSLRGSCVCLFLFVLTICMKGAYLKFLGQSPIILLMMVVLLYC